MLFKKIVQSNYFLYKSLKKILGQKKLLVSKKTDIVIEGFPRSANTFTVLMFKHYNQDCNIAHHMHVVAQLKGALKYNTPCVVLIREPENAIKSLLVRSSAISIQSAVSMYLEFYSFVSKHKNRFVISNFTDSIQYFGRVIESVNIKYNTNFNSFETKEEDIDQIFNQIDRLTNTVDKAAGEFGVARPSEEKEKHKHKITIPSEDLKKCKKIYSQLIEKY